MDGSFEQSLEGVTRTHMDSSIFMHELVFLYIYFNFEECMVVMTLNDFTSQMNLICAANEGFVVLL